MTDNTMHAKCRYVECTSSVIQALTLFHEKYPGHRKDEIDQCIRRATEFIEKLQNDDGSWLVPLKHDQGKQESSFNIHFKELLRSEKLRIKVYIWHNTLQF
jgi:hypothetical protein